MMFESVWKHFVKIQHVKRGKTSVPGLDALFRGTELAKMVLQQNQSFYPVRPQTIFEIVSKHFANFQHVKRGKNCILSLKELFRVPNMLKWFRNEINHSNSLNLRRCLRVIQSIS